MSTTPGAFFLDGEARGGAYDYDLVQVGTDYFLQSTFCTKHDGTTVTRTTVATVLDGSCSKPAIWGRVFGEQVNDRFQQFGDPHATGESFRAASTSGAAA